MGIVQNPRKTRILLKRHFRKIVGVILGINKLKNATRLRVFQDSQYALLRNPRKTCILLKRRFRKIVGVGVGINKPRSATKHRVFRSPKWASCKTLGKRAFCHNDLPVQVPEVKMKPTYADPPPPPTIVLAAVWRADRSTPTLRPVLRADPGKQTTPRSGDNKDNDSSATLRLSLRTPK